MLNNIRGILNRRNEQNRSPESLLSSKSSDDGVENNASSGSAEGFLCPDCFLAYPNADDLHNHYESAHSNKDNAGELKFNCPACKMKLGSEIELQSHFARNHSDKKEDVELRAMALQVKALEEGKELLQTELQSVLKDRTKLKEEKDALEQKAAKLASDLADLKLNLDELNSKKMYLESSLKISQERVSKLEVEMQQRPEEDDVIELKKGIKSVQEKMNELALQKEDEKDSLQKQYNELQEASLKLQTEKASLENFVRTCPKKEEMESLQSKISEMSVTISNLKEALSAKEVEKTKLQVYLEKFENYDEIKTSLIEKQNYAEELLRQSNEKDVQINKLKEELNKIKDQVEGSKNERERLFSEIAKGEGANAAMLQLKEENSRLQEQFLNQQTLHLQAIDEVTTKINELRKSLKKTEITLLAANEKCGALEKELKTSQEKLTQVQAEKDLISKELNLQIANLSASQGTDKARLQTLEIELSNLKKLCDEKTATLENLTKELKLERASHSEVVEKLQTAKKNQEQYISDLAGKLTSVQSDIANKELSLAEAEETNRDILNQLEEVRKSKVILEEKHKKLKNENLEIYDKIKNFESALAENEATKVEFCDRISSLNEELLKSQLKESELSAALEHMTELHSQVEEKLLTLEDELLSLRNSVTCLQNEKNSLLNELDQERKSAKKHLELVASQEKKINDLTELKNKETANYQKIQNEFQLAKDVYLNDKMKMQKQIENLENDCAKQLSVMQETVRSLETHLEEAEERNSCLNNKLTETKELLRQNELELEKANSHHIAQVDLLNENVQTLREDLASEQKRRENIELKLDEISGTKLELEAKLENALEERSGLLKRCIKSEGDCEKLTKSITDMRHKYDDCVAALQELGRENQTLQVENMKHITRKWADDAEVTHCTACGKLFNLTVRKHHCRNCGNIFCNECSTKSATVASSKKPVRVCDVCFVEVTK